MFHCSFKVQCVFSWFSMTIKNIRLQQIDNNLMLYILTTVWIKPYLSVWIKTFTYLTVWTKPFTYLTVWIKPFTYLSVWLKPNLLLIFHNKVIENYFMNSEQNVHLMIQLSERHTKLQQTGSWLIYHI